MKKQSIGVFDSGFGGLTVFKEIAKKMPQYNYIYLGDNARSPYGDCDFETVYQYTLSCVEWLFEQGCQLVVLACNTASAKALRSIQQNVLVEKYPHHRVLGVIRPTAEIIGNYTKTQHIGIMGTRGTVKSNSYALEIAHFYPDIKVFQQACPMWVPLIENNEHLSDKADAYVQAYIDELLIQNDKIDCILLACTHYPLLIPKIKKYLPSHISLVSQGSIIANSLADYLNRHSEIEQNIETKSEKLFFTTGDTLNFNTHATLFFEEEVNAKKAIIL
ncbi:MAG: glutamate racemase [Sphingobacteriaceae bacterium]|nr:glutamate racemase [Sphingobacteriaceae bacterium]